MKATMISAHQFSLCRMILAVYLCVHFLGLFPVGVELFSAQGMITDPALLPSWGKLPNLFWISDAPQMVYFVLGLGVCLSILLGLGWQRRWVSLVLWLIWMSLFNRNILISNPSIPYIGLLLLVLAALPTGEPFARKAPSLGWQIPNWVAWGLLISLMGGYTASGLHKLTSPSWVDGTALQHVLNLPLGRNYFLRTWMLESPGFLLKGMTWTALGLEILALPLSLIRPARKWIWLALLLMNCVILLVIDFADLSLGIVVMHLFCFDRSWLSPVKMSTEHPVVYFDGVCGLCNHLVDFTIAEDLEERFHFATIQGESAKEINIESVQSGESMALKDGDTIYTQSDAVLMLVGGLGGLWRVFSMFCFVFPRVIRNAVYFQVQKRRYNIFGEHETCRIPTAAERARFLP